MGADNTFGETSFNPKPMKPKTKQTKFDGKIGLVIGEHPHNGSMAKCIGAEKTGIGWGMKFEDIYTGFKFFVFDVKNISWKSVTDSLK